jgi:DNA-binding NarL/FixJ family response regulator
MSQSDPERHADPRPIRVFVVDDHAVVRRGMQAYLELIDDVELVGDAASGQQALDRILTLAAAGQPPDVVMMDLVMPGLDGIATTAALKERHPEVEVVAMTSFSEGERVHRALQAGAAGYLLKDAEADAVASAIRAAHRGEVHLDPVVAQQLTRSLRTPRPQALTTLTERELEVLTLLAQGLPNKDIAKQLVISERTARTHVSSILAKLDLASRTQAALWAIREGLSSAPSQFPGQQPPL